MVLNLPFKSFASLRGLCLKSGAIHIYTAGDAAAAHYQHPSSSDMLWRLALCAAAPTTTTCISPSPSQGQISAEAPSATCAKARTQHEMGFIREQLRLLVYLNTHSTHSRLSNCVKRLSMCAESILISSPLPLSTSSLRMTKQFCVD